MKIRIDLRNGSRSSLKIKMSYLIQDFSARTMILINSPNLITLMVEADTIGQRKLIMDLKLGTKDRPLNGWNKKERDVIRIKTTMKNRRKYSLRSVTIEFENMLSTNVSTEANGYKQIRPDQ